MIETPSPSEACQKLAVLGVKTIVPISEEELLSQPRQVPYAAALSRVTLSLPIFPAMEDSEVAQVAEGLVSIV